MSNHRIPRVEEQIREILAEVVTRDLKDPRIPMLLTIREVRVTRDLSEAKIYFSQLPDDEESVEATLDALEGAAGFLRTQVAHRVTFKTTPQLRFFYDDTEQRAQRIEQILAESDIPPAADAGPDGDGGDRENP